MVVMNILLVKKTSSINLPCMASPMGARRQGQGGSLALWKFYKVFCALEVIAKKCFDACFEGHLPSWTCVLRVTTKKGRQLF